MAQEIKKLKAEIRRLRKVIAGLTPSLEVMLQRRGFRIYKKEPSDDLLIPERDHLSTFYQRLKKYSFRIFLRDVIKHQDGFTLDDVTRYTTRRVAEGYLDYMVKTGLVEEYMKGRYRLTKRPIKSFGETLEWFVSRLLKNEFNAEVSWGLRFKRPRVGGDYDLIAKIDNLLLYMEIKSSPPKQIYDREIGTFLNRISDLSPDIGIFFVDTELRMKDKIVPMFEEELKKRYTAEIPVERIKKELFHINKKVFIINAKGGISSNIQTVLEFYWHRDLLKN